MNLRKLTFTVAFVAGALVAAAGSGATAAATTVLQVAIDDGFPASGGPGVFSDAATTLTNSYDDYRIGPSGPSDLNFCVEAEPAPPGNLFILLNRKLDGPAGVLRCSENGGTSRNFVLKIANEDVCDLLAEPAAGLELTNAAGIPWNTAPAGTCVLATVFNPRIRMGTLYKARAKTTNIDFLLGTDLPVSYEIQSDALATITPSSLVPALKSVAYTGTYHLVRFAPKARTVGPAFSMPVKMDLLSRSF